jgi:phosphoglycerate kinase
MDNGTSLSGEYETTQTPAYLSIKSLRDAGNVTGKRVLVRADLNVPIKDGVVTNNYRIKKALPTIEYLRSHGARVIVVSHLGRDPDESLKPVYEAMQGMIQLSFVPKLLGSDVQEAISKMNNGDVLLLENLRSDAREGEGDDAFAQELAALADMYVNEAFSASHREHASIVGIPKYIKGFAGLQFEEEVKHLSKALTPESPSLCILGGAKFETKEAFIKAVLVRYDHVFLGGALANDAFAAQNLPVGRSLVSEHPEGLVPLLEDAKIMLPVDVTVDGPSGVAVRKPGDVHADEAILDAGPETVTELGRFIAHAKTILWNGPVGNFENGFSMQTESIARLVAESPAQSYIGGGDTEAAIEKLGIAEHFTFVSTGGGAMLDFLVDGKLPGIDALVAS